MADYGSLVPRHDDDPSGVRSAHDGITEMMPALDNDRRSYVSNSSGGGKQSGGGLRKVLVIVGIVVAAAVLALVVATVIVPMFTSTGTSPASSSSAAESASASASSAVASASVPDVKGKTIADAETLLHEAGFEYVTVDADGQSVSVINKPNWKVLDQSPKDGETADTGTQVKLTVERSEASASASSEAASSASASAGSAASSETDASASASATSGAPSAASSSASSAAVDSAQKVTVVLATAKFHRPECSHLSGDDVGETRSMSLSTAWSLGYSACPDCASDLKAN